MDHPQTLKFSRRNLPHWLVEDHSYFVTIRLKNTLPADLINEFKVARKQAVDQEKCDRECFMKIERVLDRAESNRNFLDRKEVAEIVLDSLKWLESKGWTFYAVTILSTHLHLLMRNFAGSSAEMLEHLSRYKNYTARKANEILGLKGHFWAREDFDHWIRTPQKFEATVRYIANNPVKARRVERWDGWPWTVVHPDVRYCLGD